MYDYEIETDDDFRNATPWTAMDRRVREHGPNRTRTIVVPARPGAGGLPVRPPRHPYPYGYPQPFVYVPAKPDNAKLFRTVGVVVDLLGQALASFMPLPTPPTLTGVARDDDENMKRYHEALAKHAKTDERIRTIARVVREALDLKAQ